MLACLWSLWWTGHLWKAANVSIVILVIIISDWCHCICEIVTNPDKMRALLLWSKILSHTLVKWWSKQWIVNISTSLYNKWKLKMGKKSECLGLLNFGNTNKHEYTQLGEYKITSGYWSKQSPCSALMLVKLVLFSWAVKYLQILFFQLKILQYAINRQTLGCARDEVSLS